MIRTFIDLPRPITEAISRILAEPEHAGWLLNAEKLHARYMNRDKNTHTTFIQNSLDSVAYLGLRVSATYAQIYAALLQIQERIPSWKPTSMWDIGCGPGTGLWAATSVWSSIHSATCLDYEKTFLTLGEKISKESGLSLSVTWSEQDLVAGLRKTTTSYDLIIVANVLNEVTLKESEHILEEIYEHCNGIMVILEPGTPYGFEIIQKTAARFSRTQRLIAPYINNSFVKSEDYWIHFSQRFIRPLFQRQIRQRMRESTLMASNWEETKYTYVAVGKIFPEEKVWGRCIGDVKKQKGYLEIPILTQKGIIHQKILKRSKKEYAYAKKLLWGQIISTKEALSNEL